MEEIVATISKDGKVLLRDVTAWIEIVSPKRGLKSWHGSFVQPSGSYFSPGEYVPTAADGRTGEIIVTLTSFTGNANAEFTGSGPFEKP